jgi:hypothetical protein
LIGEQEKTYMSDPNDPEMWDELRAMAEEGGKYVPDPDPSETTGR